MLLQTTPPVPGTPESGNVIGTFLANYGVPYAETLGAGITFVIAFLAVVFAGRLIVLPLVDRMLESRNLDRHVKKPLRKATWIAVLFVGISVAFGFAGLGNFLTSLATIAAAATLAIGFAMQDVIKNFVAGIFIYTDRPFRIGDWIEWDGYSGVVQDISLRVTRVETFDSELLTVPNTHLTDNVIKNPVANEQLRLRFLFGIGYDDDIAEASQIIGEEAAAHDGIADDPEPTVRLTELDDSSVGLESRIWIDDPRHSDFVKTRSEFVTAVKNRFDAAGIEFPYPQRELSGGIGLEGGIDE